MKNRIRALLGFLVSGFILALFFALSGCGAGGGTDDKVSSDNVSTTTNCVQEIVINVSSPAEVEEGDEVETEDGVMVVDKIQKIETNDQGVAVTATVCSPEDNDTTNLEGQADVQASLLPN